MVIEQHLDIPYHILVSLMQNASALTSQSVCDFIVSLQLNIRCVKYQTFLADALVFGCPELANYLTNKYLVQHEPDLMITSLDTLYAAISSRNIPAIALCRKYYVEVPTTAIAKAEELGYDDILAALQSDLE